MPDTSVYSTYDTLRGLATGLHRIDSANTNVFASTLIAPELTGQQLLESPRTHLAYNCTTTSVLWHLQQDPNVLRLETFEAGDRATMTLRVADCHQVLTSSVDRIVVGNEFVGAEFASSPMYFHVLRSAEVDGITSSNSTFETCSIRLEMEQATFAQVYPDCRIKFHSTDINNLVRTESTEAAILRRRLDSSTFGFVKDSTCKYDCGEVADAGEIDVDKCWAKVSGIWTDVKCKLQFYEENSACTSECSAEGHNETLAASQCYACSSSDGSCASGYTSTDDGCCRVLECEAVDDTTISTLNTLTWNLEEDALVVSNTSYPIFETANCSNTSDPSTNCCRITCENCFLNVSIASIFADVEIVGMSFEEAIEMELTGNANLEVALYAPNGCKLDETTQLKNVSFNIPLGNTGISVKIAMGLDLRRKISLQPHGSTAIVGATAELQSLTAGSLRSETFYDVQITTNTSNKLAQSSIDLEMELELVPSFQASLVLLKNVAQVGINAEFLVFVELNSTFQYPAPFPGRSSKYLDDSSLWQGGNCQLPHYMEYNCNAGYGEVNISIPLSVKIPVIGNKTTELDIVSSSSRSSFNLFSGCVATAYDAKILLSTAIDAVSSLSDDAKHALRTILVWTLGMNDIDSDFVNITSVSASTGEIYVTMSVPPSLGELYPTASSFVDEVYQRARNQTFATAVSNYVGMDIAAQCDDDRWGAQCDKVCSARNCTSGSITCNAVDGTTLSCSSCKVGYWGTTCELSCQVPDGCTYARCNQSSGVQEECVTCDESGSLCSGISSASNTVVQFTSAAVSGFVGICLFLLH